MPEGLAAPLRNLRLFVAIELPEVVRDALASAIGDLQRAGAVDGLRWVRPEGMHLTLRHCIQCCALHPQRSVVLADGEPERTEYSVENLPIAYNE